MNLFITLLFSTVSFAQFYDHESALRVLQKEMEKIIVRAKECIPRKDQLCTGEKFDEARLKALHLTDLSACRTAIQKYQFKLLSEKQIGNKHPDFTNSTIRALTLFKEKLVLYKTSEFNRIDCIHELLHIYQHDPKSNWDLAPVTRKYIEQKFMNHLNLAISEVEKAEKTGNVKEAMQMNNTLRPYIKFMKEFMALDEWLNEKDIQYFIYIQCEDFKCTDLDKDIAVTNLFKLIPYFPEESAALIKKDAAVLMALKEKKARIQVEKTWRATPFNNRDISKWLNLSWEDLIKMMKKKNIRLSRVEGLIKFPELKDVTIPKNLLLTLPMTSNNILQDSKIQSGEAFAKFLPGKTENSIILTPISTRASLVHEYLHYLQFKTNEEYATALLEGQRLLPLFMAGKISRQFYEETTMKNNVLFWTAEYEIYKTLVNFKDQISKLEHINNVELFEYYKKKLKKD